MKSKIESLYLKHEREKVCQGDIFRDYKLPLMAGKDLDIPYMVILTQECDLDEDFNNHKAEQVTEGEDPATKEGEKKHDKYLQSILVCPIYLAEQLRKGQHLKDMDLTMENYNSDRWNLIKLNKNDRYHFLKGDINFQIPDCVVDFKHYYTIPRDLLYSNYRDHYIGTINELFREALSQRFANYLCRIGLPPLQPKIKDCGI